jgi:hypothetical protein
MASHTLRLRRWSNTATLPWQATRSSYIAGAILQHFHHCRLRQGIMLRLQDFVPHIRIAEKKTKNATPDSLKGLRFLYQRDEMI